MNNDSNRYFTFLLRLWPENSGAEAAAGWRATLEDARSGERVGFANLEQLFTHLMQLVESGGKSYLQETRADGPMAQTSAPDQTE
jgi:hypothetical protein